MNLWNYVFAVSYNYYGRFKNQDQRFGALCVVATCIMTLVFISIILLGKVLNQNLLLRLPNKYCIIPFLLLELYLLHKYYSNFRTEQIISKFDRLSTTKRDIWKLATIFFLVGPIIVIGVLLKK